MSNISSWWDGERLEGFEEENNMYYFIFWQDHYIYCVEIRLRVDGGILLGKCSRKTVRLVVTFPQPSLVVGAVKQWDSGYPQKTELEILADRVERQWLMLRIQDIGKMELPSTKHRKNMEEQILSMQFKETICPQTEVCRCWKSLVQRRVVDWVSFLPGSPAI